jgi:hypothetical protein
MMFEDKELILLGASIVLLGQLSGVLCLFVLGKLKKSSLPGNAQNPPDNAGAGGGRDFKMKG